MNVKQFIRVLTTAAVVLLTASYAVAQGNGHGNGNGGGGGGGGGGTPPGTIYFRHEGTMWQMDGAGTPASRIPLATVRDYGDPSYALHGDQRWFVYDYVEYGSVFPNGRQFVDIRAGNEVGQEFGLLSQSNIEVISSPIWAADDASITFIGEQWELDAGGVPEPNTAYNAGLWELLVTFTNGTPVAGPLSFIADLSSQMHVDAGGFRGQELAGHSWSPDGTAFSFGLRSFNSSPSFQEIWIVDLGEEEPAVQLLASGQGVGWPQWSPDGSRIGYVSSSGTVVHELATGRKKTLKRTPLTSWGPTIWSPSGDYLVIGHWDNFLSGYDAIYRCTAAFGSKTELTAGLDDPPPAFNVLIPVGWRE